MLSLIFFFLFFGVGTGGDAYGIFLKLETLTQFQTKDTSSITGFRRDLSIATCSYFKPLELL